MHIFLLSKLRKKNLFALWAAIFILCPLPSLAITKEKAIDDFYNKFPKARLVDVYKSFYQDNFGPGHLLGDSLAARKYFFSELQDTANWGGPVFEFTGEGKNFVRLNMDLVRKGIIPAEVYFKAFQNSVGRVESPSDDFWIAEWAQVDSILNAKNYHFPKEDQDRQYIEGKLQQRNFPIHHSDEFNETYNFHYRIISLPEFAILKENYLSEISDTDK